MSYLVIIIVMSGDSILKQIFSENNVNQHENDVGN